MALYVGERVNNLTRVVVVLVRDGRDEFIDDVEANVLYTVIGVESQPEIAAGRLDQRRLEAATVATDQRRVAERPVDHL